MLVGGRLCLSSLATWFTVLVMRVKHSSQFLYSRSILLVLWPPGYLLPYVNSYLYLWYSFGSVLCPTCLNCSRCLLHTTLMSARLHTPLSSHLGKMQRL